MGTIALGGERLAHASSPIAADGHDAGDRNPTRAAQVAASARAGGGGPSATFGQPLLPGFEVAPTRPAVRGDLRHGLAAVVADAPARRAELRRRLYGEPDRPVPSAAVRRGARSAA
jgi:hypothetical protein